MASNAQRGIGCEAELLDLIGAIYDAALAPEDLPQLLSRFNHLCGGVWTVMSVIPLNGGNPLSLQNSELDTEHLVAFESKYNRLDTNPSLPLLLASRPGDILLQEVYYNDREWERFDMYQEIYRPIEAHSSLGVVLHKSADYLIPFGILRPRTQGRFSPEDLALLKRVVPHLKRMMQIMLHLGEAETKAQADEALWDRLPYGVVLLDETGRILWTNAAADMILSQGEGLVARGGTLHAAGAEENAALLKLIGEAADTARGRGTRSGGALAVPRGARRPLALLVAPFCMDKSARMVFPRRPAVVAFLSDLERNPEAPAKLLAQLYRLTERESALVALLLEGRDLREAAERLGVGMNTVRTHLRQVFDKTGTRRQAELVGLLLRSVVMLGGRSGADR